MPSYSQLVRTPQLLSLGRQRGRVDKTIAPRKRFLESLPVIDMAPADNGRYEEASPKLNTLSETDVPSNIDEQTPEEAHLTFTADRRAPLGLKDLATSKSISAAMKGVLGTIAGATPRQIAKAVVAGQMTPLAGLALINKFTAPTIARENRMGAVRQAAKAYNTKDLADAYDLATQDLVSQSIGMGPMGFEINEPTPEQVDARQKVDQADVSLSNLNRSLTDLATQKMANLAPQKLQDLVGYVETPVVDATYNAPEDLSFETLSPEERADIGASYTDPETGEEKAAEAYETGPKAQEEISLPDILVERLGVDKGDNSSDNLGYTLDDFGLTKEAFPDFSKIGLSPVGVEPIATDIYGDLQEDLSAESSTLGGRRSTMDIVSDVNPSADLGGYSAVSSEISKQDARKSGLSEDISSGDISSGDFGSNGDMSTDTTSAAEAASEIAASNVTTGGGGK